jgi:outer membrane protein OmpA-like peptidoglycan-associated protein
MRFLYFTFFFYLFANLSPLLAQDDIKLAIEVRDKRSQRPIPAIVSVVALGSESELKGKMTNEKYEVVVKTGEQYRIFSALQEYKTYRQTHVFEKNANEATQSLILNLEPLGNASNVPVAATPLQKIKITDSQQPDVTLQATVKIKNTNTGETILPTKTNDGTWLAELTETDTYEIEAQAKDYELYKGILKTKPNGVIEIPLNRTSKFNFSFQAIDAITGKPVAARFKISDRVRETYSGSTTTDGRFFELTLPPKAQTYELVTTASGYRASQTTLVVSSNPTADQTRRIIKLSQADISVKFKIRNAQTGQPVTANVRVIDQTDKRAILNVKNAPKGEAAVQLNPERRYVLEVESAGFTPYQQPLEKAILKLESENSLIIKLNQLGDTFASLSAIDGATGKRIAAVFKVVSSSSQNNEAIQSKTTEPTFITKFKVSEPAIFSIETSAAGYRTHRGELDAEEFNAGKVFNYEAIMTAEPKKVVEVKKAPEPAPKPAEPTKVVVNEPVAKAAEEKKAPIVEAAPKIEEKKLPTSFVFQFRIADAQTKKVINAARIKIVNAANRQPVVTKGNAANTQAELQVSQSYLLEVEAPNYDKFLTKIEVTPNNTPADLKRQITLVKKTANAKKGVVNDKVFDNVKLGEAVTIEDNVYFDQSSYILRPEAHGQLNRLVDLMSRNRKLKVQIAGFTDNVGDPRLNLILSENRAKVIANYLVYKGISEARISHLGYGQTKPIAENDTEENKRKNRRVEFVIKEE